MNLYRSPDAVFDPVCGMALSPGHAAASLQGDAGPVYFCSAGCRDRYQNEPHRYTAAAAGAGHDCHESGGERDASSPIRLAVPLGAGFSGTAALLAVYFGLLGLLSGWDATVMQFEQYWGYITALATGFGIQVGLFLYLHRAAHAAARSGRVVAVTGTTSGVAMVSCCTHYVANLVPVLGSAGLATLVAQYQVELFWFGLAANLAGIGYMTKRIIEFHRAKMGASQAASAISAVLLAAIVTLAVPHQATAAQDGLAAQVNNEGGVSVRVTPLDLAPDRPWRFEVQLNTHSVALVQDIVSSAVLVTGDGEEVPVQEWAGDPPGGHHRSGILAFSPQRSAQDTITLKIRGIATPERVFVWRHSDP